MQVICSDALMGLSWKNLWCNGCTGRRNFHAPMLHSAGCRACYSVCYTMELGCRMLQPTKLGVDFFQWSCTVIWRSGGSGETQNWWSPVDFLARWKVVQAVVYCPQVQNLELLFNPHLACVHTYACQYIVNSALKDEDLNCCISGCSTQAWSKTRPTGVALQRPVPGAQIQNMQLFRDLNSEFFTNMKVIIYCVICV